MIEVKCSFCFIVCLSAKKNSWNIFKWISWSQVHFIYLFLSSGVPTMCWRQTSVVIGRYVPIGKPTMAENHCLPLHGHASSDSAGIRRLSASYRRAHHAAWRCCHGRPATPRHRVCPVSQLQGSRRKSVRKIQSCAARTVNGSENCVEECDRAACAIASRIAGHIQQ